MTTFIAALDLSAVEHTLAAVRICACAAGPNRGGGGRPHGQGGARRARTAGGHGQYPAGTFTDARVRRRSAQRYQSGAGARPSTAGGQRADQAAAIPAWL